MAPRPLNRFGLLASEIRSVTTLHGLWAWVIPELEVGAAAARSHADGGYSTGGWSGPVESVARLGLFGWTESLEGIETYYGLIPDGNATVVLTLLDGSRIEVSVIDNVLIARPNWPGPRDRVSRCGGRSRGATNRDRRFAVAGLTGPDERYRMVRFVAARRVRWLDCSSGKSAAQTRSLLSRIAPAETARVSWPQQPCRTVPPYCG